MKLPEVVYGSSSSISVDKEFDFPAYKFVQKEHIKKFFDPATQ